MRILLTCWLVLISGLAHAQVTFSGPGLSIEADSWQILASDSLPMPEDLAANIDAYHWESRAEIQPRLSGSTLVICRLTLDVDYDGTQQPLFLLSPIATHTGSVGLIQGNKVLMWQSLAGEVQGADYPYQNKLGIVPLPITEPGRYELLVTTEADSTHEILRGSGLRLDQRHQLHDLPAAVSITSLLLGTLLVYLLFCTVLLAHRFRTELLYAVFFLLGAASLTALRDRLLFLHWHLDSVWWVEHFLMLGVGLMNGGIILYISTDFKATGWKTARTILKICALVTVLMGLTNPLFPVREYNLTAQLMLASSIFAFILALGLILIRAWKGSLRDRIFMACVGSFLLAMLYRMTTTILVIPINTSSAPLYATISITGAYIFIEHALMLMREYVKEASRRSADLTRIDLISRFSHELRTPLNAVIGLADLMRETRDGSKIGNYASMIQGAGHTLLGLVNDILDFSKLGSSSLTLRQSPFRLDTMTTDVMTGFLPLIIETQTACYMSYGDDLPMFLVGDEGRFKQILTNLINNAFKFSEPGSEVIVAVKRLKTVGDKVELFWEVIDHGRGIPEDKLTDIFEPYTQAQIEDGAHLRGTGLGLAICKLLVEEMGGQIGVKSEAGKGTTFFFNVWMTLDPHAPDLNKCFAPLRDKQLLIIANPQSGIQAIKGLADHWFKKITVADSCSEVPEDTYDAVMIESVFSSATEQIEWIKQQPEHIVIEVAEVQPSGWVDQLEHPNVHRMLLPVPVLSVIAQFVEDLTGEKVAFEKENELIKTSTRSRFNVLLIDDNIVNLTVASKMLESLGANCEKAQSGKAGLELLQSEHTYNLVLLDCEMPEMSGFEMCRQWRNHEKEQGLTRIPIVALTAHAMSEVRDECLAAGMDDVLYKPVGRDAIINVLNSLNTQKGAPPFASPV